MLDCSKLDDLAVGGREDGVRVGVKWAYSWFESAVEESGEVRVDV
jgi:hypothetical protein